MAAKMSLMTEEHWCEFCAMTGRKSLMQPHKPLRDHYYCTTCGSVLVDWPPIYKRVKAAILYEYGGAKARLAALPALSAIRYDSPYVDGGEMSSQQEMHIAREAHDHWIVSVFENTIRHSLTSGQKKVIWSLYIERWSYRVTADKLQIAKSTVEKWEEEALQAFARTAQWA